MLLASRRNRKNYENQRFINDLWPHLTANMHHSSANVCTMHTIVTRYGRTNPFWCCCCSLACNVICDIYVSHTMLSSRVQFTGKINIKTDDFRIIQHVAYFMSIAYVYLYFSNIHNVSKYRILRLRVKNRSNFVSFFPPKYINLTFVINISYTQQSYSLKHRDHSLKIVQKKKLPDFTHFTASSMEQNVGSRFIGWLGSGEYV